MAMIHATRPLTTPAVSPPSNQTMARSSRRSGSGLALASARPSKKPHTAAPITNIVNSTMLISADWVCHALISAP